jgi:hypothetical protein
VSYGDGIVIPLEPDSENHTKIHSRIGDDFVWENQPQFAILRPIPVKSIDFVKGCKTPDSPSELQILQDAIKKIDQKQSTPKIYSKKQAIVDKLSINLI